MYYFRYLWIKHNNQNDIKEGPISNFMPKIDCQIDAAYWVPQRSTAYLFNGTDIVWHCVSLNCLQDIKQILSATFNTGTIFWTVKGSQVKGRPKNISSLGFPSWVQQIDAAVHIHKTVHTLFFTQHQYWRWTIEIQQPRITNISFNYMNDMEKTFLVGIMNTTRLWMTQAHVTFLMISQK